MKAECALVDLSSRVVDDRSLLRFIRMWWSLLFLRGVVVVVERLSIYMRSLKGEEEDSQRKKGHGGHVRSYFLFIACSNERC